MNKNDVTFQREEYKAAESARRLVNDVVEGSEKVKAGGTLYLPQPNPTDTSEENKERYKQYVKRATFFNATGKTLSSLVGAAFRTDPMLDAAPSLDYVAEDIDGSGVNIYQQSQCTLEGVLKSGGHGLLVDYPTTDAPATRADMLSGAIRATTISIEAEQITNWKVERVGAKNVLTMLVISEMVEEPTPDGFGYDLIKQFRVLRLGEGYTQEIWRKSDDKWYLYQEPFEIIRGDGRRWDEIPFAFVGATNNDSTIDQAPLYDLAEINIAHYRNSADYEDSCFLIGQPQPWLSGLTEEWRDWMQESGLYLGSRAPWLLPESGSAGIAQAKPNTLAKEAMDQKEAQMIALGARLLQEGSAVKTATQVSSEQESSHSVLSLAVSNVSDAYTKCLNWMAVFMGDSKESVYEINQEFVKLTIDAQMLTALVSAYQSGQYPRSDLWSQLKQYGLIDPEKTTEEIEGELEADDNGLGLDDPIS